MTNQDVGKMLFRFAKKHAGAILTVVATVGVVATSVEASRATLKAKEVIETKKEERKDWKETSGIDQPPLSKEEIVKDCWKLYIPTAIIGVGTVSCIIIANALTSKEQKSLAAAYAMIDQGYKAYRKKVSDRYGEDVDRDISNEVIEESEDDEYDSDKLMFYDVYSDRYFEGTMNKFHEAVNYVNRELQISGYASVNDFYRMLGISETEEGNAIGWNIEEIAEMLGYCWLDFDVKPTNLGDDTVCYVIQAFYTPNISFMGE